MRFVIPLLVFWASATIAQSKYDVYLPENYDATKKYPLFMVLHGGTGNKTIMRRFWQSDRMAKEFISVYMEASTVDRSPDRFGWRDVATERRNLRQYFEEISKQYPIDEKRMIAGGYSLGGKMSIDMVLDNKIPVVGFISLNHGGGTTDLFIDKNLVSARERGIRGVVIAGEKDDHYIKQSHMIRDKMKALDLEIIYIENRGVGHTKPENFGQQIDDAIAFIFNES